jgi:DNA (cytosine-5)-methyltransferase 1
MKEINLLDLFSGIGGFHLGLERAGFKINSYNSEIDKYAVQVYKHNFKDSKYVGSITDVRGSELPRINGITFGSPCQDFSLAGKRRGMSGERSSLILEAIRLIKECRPDFFIWENVKGTFSSNNRQDFAAILQAFTNVGGYRLEWQLLNTKWFLPQNRERVYLVGYLGDGSRGKIFPIGESDRKVDELQGQQANSCTLTTRYEATGNGSYIAERKQYAQIKTNNSKGFEEMTEEDSLNYSNPNSKTRRGRVGKGVAQTLDTGCEQAVIGAIRGRNPDNPSDRSKGAPLKQTLEVNSEGVSNTLTSVQKDNYVVKIGDYRNDEGYRERKDGDAPYLTVRRHSEKDISTMPAIIDKIRRLTPIECERLQGFPDNWTQYGSEGSISDTQRYKMCGNAVTVDVVEAVGKRIKDVVYG